jgi:hypothetical protein
VHYKEEEYSAKTQANHKTNEKKLEEKLPEEQFLGQ